MNCPVPELFRQRAAFLLALVAFAFLLVLSGSPLHAQSAKTFFKRGQAAEARQDYDAAFENYQQAAAKKPNELAYRTSLVRIRVSASGLHMTQGRKLLQGGDQTGALAEFLHAAEIDPGNEAAQQAIARIKELQGQAPPQSETSLPQAPGAQAELDSLGPPVTLKPLSNEPLTLHYSEDAKVVYQAIGKAAGINVLFDPDYNSKRIQVDLNNSSLLDALRVVGTQSGTFWRPITPNTIFVAQNTRAKRTELEEQAVQTFYLSNAWQQNDLNDVQTALRNVLTNVKVYGVTSQNAIVIRGTPDELLLAQKLVNDLDKARPEVVVDIAVLEVSKNWERTLGIAWPSSIGAALQPPCTSGSSNCNSSSTGTDQFGNPTSTGTSGSTPSLYDLSHLKAADFAITIGAATANLLLTNSNTKILQNPRIRATDAQKATLTIGEKIPIATGSYQTGAATALVSSLVNTQFQFEEVGVKVEMTPTVHFDHDVTLKVKIEVSSEAGSTTISGVTEPIIAQNIVDQVIRLREGEASILGGIEQKQETTSWNGIPGLSAIPILKYLFGSRDHTINDEDLVFLLVPHIVRTQELDPINLRTIDTGVGNQIELRHVSSANSQAASAPAVLPVRPPSTRRSTVGTVPGQSAEAAAPAALQQLHQAADATGTVATDAATSQAQSQPAAPAAPAQPVNIALVQPNGPVAVGSTFKVPVVLNGGKDVASVPLQIQYDPARLALVNVDQGDFLGRGGQAVALVHREDGSGNVTINTALPPGAAGVNGDGTVCTLSFTAKAPGETSVSITRPAALNSAQQPLQATGGQTTIQVQ
ncbi:MAG TPA: cohesin domain-containing protein [Terracidiphilus sp.]|nr:cohesin domain-containing protein [Terracidiphilus sp.]